MINRMKLRESYPQLAKAVSLQSCTHKCVTQLVGELLGQLYLRKAQKIFKKRSMEQKELRYLLNTVIQVILCAFILG